MRTPSPRTRPARLSIAAVVALTPILALSPILGLAAAGATTPTFVPIGAGYTAETLEQFTAEAAAVDTSGVVSILVLPITYGVDPLSMSNGLRTKNLTLADTRSPDRGRLPGRDPSWRDLSRRARPGPHPLGRL